MEIITLPKTIANLIRKKAEENNLTIEEFLIDLLTRDIDPNDRARKYIEAALELLKQAKIELEKNNLRQASEKIWGAAALSIKAYAYARERKILEKHVHLWQYKSKVAEELGDWVRVAWLMADSMHKNFYEDLADRKDIECALTEVEKLVKTIASKILKS